MKLNARQVLDYLDWANALNRDDVAKILTQAGHTYEDYHKEKWKMYCDNTLTFLRQWNNDLIAYYNEQNTQ